MTIVFHSLKVEIGESQTYYFQKYHLEYGLNLFRVFDIKQDSTGFIWFSHLKGVSVYDGFEFKELLSQNDNPKPQFVRIFIDKKDIKWFLPQSVKDSILYYENKEWKSIKPVLLSDASSFHYAIDVYYENGKPVIYAGTSNGLYRYSGENWTRCTEGLKRKFEDINNIYRYGEKLLLCTNSGLLTYRNGIIDSTEFDFLSDKNVLAVKEGFNSGGQKVLWIIEPKRFGYLYEGKYFKAEPEIFVPVYQNKGLFVIETGSKNKIYFGGGYMKYSYDYVNKELIFLNRAKGFSSDGCMTIFSDFEENVWFADTRGVDKISSFSIENFFDISGLLESEVSSIVEYEKGKYLFGHNVGLTLYDGKSFKTIQLSSSINRHTGIDRVTDLAYDGKNRIWFAANNKGIGYITSEGKVFKIHDNNDDRISGVCLYKGEIIYVGAYGLYKIVNDKLVKLFSIDEIYGNARKLIIIEDAIYIMGMNGIAKYENGKLFRIKYNNVGGSPPNVFAIYQTKDKSILAGTTSGLYEILNDSIVKSNKVDLKIAVYAILEDSMGNLWIGTIDGIKKVRGNKVVEEYGVKNGLAGDEVNRAALIIDKKKKMWVGTNTGLSCITLTDSFSEKRYPRLIFISVVDSKGMEYDLKDNARIDYIANTIHFNFRGLSFVNEKLLKYRIKLEGFDKDWIEIKQNELGKIRYTNLSPGEYEFLVQAKNENGEWSPTFRTNKIFISAPFFLKWWFILISAVLLIIIIGFIAKYLFLRNYTHNLNQEIDIRKESEKALLLSESKYRTVIEQSIDGIGIFDFNTLEILEVNNSLIEITGYSSHKLINMQIDELIKTILPSADVSGNNIKNKLDKLAGEKVLIKKDGSEIFVDIGLKLLEYSGKKIIYVVIRDITERKNNEKLMEKYNEELKVLVNEKDKLFSIIAHDLRSPFTGLIGYSELLADNSDNLSEVEKKEFAGNLYKLSINLYDLVSKLLHWAQFQSGKMKYIPEKIKLKELIEELIKNFEGNLKMKRIDVSILIDGEHYVYADKNMMVILFSNLISNAIKFSNIKGVIIITSKYLTDNKSVTISVKDNGVGIPSSQLSSMFQTKRTTLTYGTNKESGTGIGLILCKDIVEKNFGSISVESREGYGSTFIVELPAE